MQGESVDEITGLARAMRSAGVPVRPGGDVLDIAGTGGDSIGSVNISTGSALIAAAAGARVAKHGNRSVSSKCGSADVIEVRHHASSWSIPWSCASTVISQEGQWTALVSSHSKDSSNDGCQVY